MNAVSLRIWWGIIKFDVYLFSLEFRKFRCYFTIKRSTLQEDDASLIKTVYGVFCGNQNMAQIIIHNLLQLCSLAKLCNIKCYQYSTICGQITNLENWDKNPKYDTLRLLLKVFINVIDAVSIHCIFKMCNFQ